MSTLLKLPRVVELVRVSTDMQRERATHEVQRHALDALRKSRPGIVVKRLEALGVSGAKGLAERDDLQELKRLSQAKAFDELRVFSVDRLTRSDDPRERAAIYGMVLDADAKIVDVNGRVIDPSRDGDLGELDYFLQTLFSARERKKIGARTLAGRKLKAAQGKLSQGRAPYGRVLNRATMTWELVPHEAEVYRRIIDAVLKGDSTRAVVKALNAAKVPPAVGSEWYTSSVKRLLRMPTMYGEYTVCGHTTQIPAIASREEFAQVRAALKRQTTCPTNVTRRVAMMRKRLVCGGCGQVARVESDGAGSVARYGCARPHERETPCPDRRTIQVPLADGAVRAALLSLVLDSDAMLRAIKSHQTTAKKTRGPDPAAIEKELAKLEARQGRTLGLLNDGLLTEEAARQELGTIRDARVKLEADRATAAAVVEVQPKRKDLVQVARELGRALKHATPERMAELLRILIPDRPGYGLTMGRSGIEMVGLLPLGAWATARDSGTSSACVGQVPGARVASFRLKVAA